MVFKNWQWASRVDDRLSTAPPRNADTIDEEFAFRSTNYRVVTNRSTIVIVAPVLVACPRALQLRLLTLCLLRVRAARARGDCGGGCKKPILVRDRRSTLEALEFECSREHVQACASITRVEWYSYLSLQSVSKSKLLCIDCILLLHSRCKRSQSAELITTCTRNRFPLVLVLYECTR